MSSGAEIKRKRQEVFDHKDKLTSSPISFDPAKDSNQTYLYTLITGAASSIPPFCPFSLPMQRPSAVDGLSVAARLRAAAVPAVGLQAVQLTTTATGPPPAAATAAAGGSGSGAAGERTARLSPSTPLSSRRLSSISFSAAAGGAATAAGTAQQAATAAVAQQVNLLPVRPSAPYASLCRYLWQ